MINLENFYVITPFFNPIRFRSRIQLYSNFKKAMALAGVKLFTVELAFGDRPFEATDPTTNPLSLRLRTWDELWHKETLINLGVKNLPHDWEYVAWIDCDIAFSRPDWALETVQQLQHHMWIQIFQTAIDLGPNEETLQIHNGFVWSYLSGKPFGSAYGLWHPGYAWAARREAFEGVGGLLDVGILGASDHHMALALIGRAEKSIPANIPDFYREAVLGWQSRALDIIRMDLGYVHGSILHYWHGKKRDRRYVERWKIIHKDRFHPPRDLMRDHQGLWTFTNLNSKLRDDIRQYFRGRNEDSIDVD